jgi:hypothetical protein
VSEPQLCLFLSCVFLVQLFHFVKQKNGSTNKFLWGLADVNFERDNVCKALLWGLAHSRYRIQDGAILRVKCLLCSGHSQDTRHLKMMKHCLRNPTVFQMKQSRQWLRGTLVKRAPVLISFLSLWQNIWENKLKEEKTYSGSWFQRFQSMITCSHYFWVCGREHVVKQSSHLIRPGSKEREQAEVTRDKIYPSRAHS